MTKRRPRFAADASLLHGFASKPPEFRSRSSSAAARRPAERGDLARQLVVPVVPPVVPPDVPWSVVVPLVPPVVPVVPLVVPEVPLEPVLLDEPSSFLPQADSDSPTTNASTVATDFVVIVIREPPGFADFREVRIDAIKLWPRDKNRALPHTTLTRNGNMAFARPEQWRAKSCHPHQK